MNKPPRLKPAAKTAVPGQLGKTIQRLRKNYKLSLSELSHQSGVAKSIISQIERNETNPTLATIWRLSQAFDVTIDQFLSESDDQPFLEKLTKRDMPIIVSEDGRCRLAIIGWIKTVEWLQWYDLEIEPGGVLDSNGHQRGAIESLSVLSGALEVEISGEKQSVKEGESLRYRSDTRHIISNKGKTRAHATMVSLLKAAVMD